MSYDEPVLRPVHGSRGREAVAAGRQVRLRRLAEAMREQGTLGDMRRWDAGRSSSEEGSRCSSRATIETLQSARSSSVVDSRAGALELPAWARIYGHDQVDERREGPGYVVQWRAPIASVARVLDGPLPEAGEPLPDGGGCAWRARRSNRSRDRDPVGFVPLGAVPEAGPPALPWGLSSRDRIWADKLATFTDRAARSQWDATRDSPGRPRPASCRTSSAASRR